MFCGPWIALCFVFTFLGTNVVIPSEVSPRNNFDYLRLFRFFLDVVECEVWCEGMMEVRRISQQQSIRSGDEERGRTWNVKILTRMCRTSVVKILTYVMALSRKQRESNVIEQIGSCRKTKYQVAPPSILSCCLSNRAFCWWRRSRATYFRMLCTFWPF